MLETGVIEVKSLSDHVFDRLLVSITSGEFRPGEKLSETNLAKTLGVSRGPLREAIRRLEGRKLVERIPNVGPRVVSLGASELVEIFHIRERLEGLAVRLATERMSDEELDALDRRLAAHADYLARQDGDGYLQHPGTDDFHYLIVTGSRSARLIELLCNDLYHLLRIYRFKSSETRGRSQAALEEHRTILRAIRSRNADEAERLMVTHIASARANLVDVIESGQLNRKIAD